MSVQINLYVGYGIILPYSNYHGDEWEDILEPYMDNGYRQKIDPHKGLSIISDGMGDEYLFVGKILRKTKPYKYFYDVVSYKEEMEKISEEEKIKLITRIRKLFKLDSVELDFVMICHHH